MAAYQKTFDLITIKIFTEKIIGLIQFALGDLK